MRTQECSCALRSLKLLVADEEAEEEGTFSVVNIVEDVDPIVDDIVVDVIVDAFPPTDSAMESEAPMRMELPPPMPLPTPLPTPPLCTSFCTNACAWYLVLMNSDLVECRLSRGLGFRGHGDRSLPLRVKEEEEE